MAKQILEEIRDLLVELVALTRKNAAAENKREIITGGYLSPNQIAKSRGCDVTKVLNWINKGELKAVNYATNLLGPKRWKISAAALEEFERLRQAVPPPPKRNYQRSSLPPVHDFVGEWQAEAAARKQRRTKGDDRKPDEPK